VQALRFVPSDCRVDETADLARCRTLQDPTRSGASCRSQLRSPLRVMFSPMARRWRSAVFH
jgi:hypothetical protein